MKKVRYGMWMFVTLVFMLSLLPETFVKAAADPFIKVKLNYRGSIPVITENRFEQKKTS
ncbi:hypothetical protein [Peribacillus simplex]|uniref:hypothetical protein n=1 Tax=Peribacillus simplex TaxID=1478 RepID=UPI003D28AE97